MNMSKYLLYSTFTLFLLIGTSKMVYSVPIAADIITVVDESGSMAGEHAFLGTTIPTLDTALHGVNVGNGADVNRYGLVGFGGSNFSGHRSGHTHLVGGAEFGSAADYTTAAGTLLLNGATEDGYDGIDHALTYAFRGSPNDGVFARQIILVTDEDRDTVDAALNFALMEQALRDAGVVLNVVVDVDLEDGNGNTALGISADGDALIADGAGGFTTAAGGVAVSGSGTTIADYVDLALNLGGAAWDLNQLRAGGLLEDSFTAAFIDKKVEEIVIGPGPGPAPIPEPSTYAMFTLGLLGLGFYKRRKKNTSKV